MKSLLLIMILITTPLMAAPTPTATMTPQISSQDLDSYDYYVTKVQLNHGRLEPSVALDGLSIVCVYSLDLTKAYVKAKNLDLITKAKFYFLVNDSTEEEFNAAKLDFDQAIKSGDIKRLMGLHEPGVSQ